MIHSQTACDTTGDIRDIETERLGARLEVARLRKYPDLSIKQMTDKLKREFHVSSATYYWHERGDRRPQMRTLQAYADFFGMPVEYFLRGEGGDTYESEAREIAARKKRTLRIDFLQGPPMALTRNVNQRLQNENLHSFQTSDLRFIVRLMAKDLEKIANGDASLADISGERLPVLPFMDAGDKSAWWKIPDYDYAMVGPGEAALPPGTICVVDFEADIEPDKFVLALLRGSDEPIVRQYISDRSWTEGVRFALKPLNPRSETIEVTDPADCLLIARIVFSGSPR